MTKNKTNNISTTIKITLPTPSDVIGNAISNIETLPNDHKHPIAYKSIERQAYLAVCDPKGIVDIYKTNRFFLQSINKPQMAKFQITEVFGSEYEFQTPPSINFFGERTKTYVMSGLVAVGANEKYLWDDQLRLFYDKHLRTTRLVEHKHIGKLVFSGNTWLGYPTSLTIMDTALQSNVKQFTMQWVVTEDNYNEYITNKNAKHIFRDVTSAKEAKNNLNSSEDTFLADLAKVSQLEQDLTTIENSINVKKDLYKENNSELNVLKNSDGTEERQDVLNNSNEQIIIDLTILREKEEDLIEQLEKLNVDTLREKYIKEWSAIGGIFTRWD